MKNEPPQNNAAKIKLESATKDMHIKSRNTISTCGVTCRVKKSTIEIAGDKIHSSMDDGDVPDVVVLTPPKSGTDIVYVSDIEDSSKSPKIKTSHGKKSAKLGTHAEMNNNNSKTAKNIVLDSDSDSSLEFVDSYISKRKVEFLRSPTRKEHNKSSNQHIVKGPGRTSMFDGLTTDEFFKRLNESFNNLPDFNEITSSTSMKTNNTDDILVCRNVIKASLKNKKSTGLIINVENEKKVGYKQVKNFQHNIIDKPPPTDGSGIGWPEEMRDFYLQPRNSKQLNNNLKKNRNHWQISPNEYLPPKQVRSNMKCHNCLRFGHIASKCKEPPKSLICFMCGEVGHTEANCFNTKCLNCGRDTQTFQRTCMNCVMFANLKCSTCSCLGHNAENCPDQWRRYYGTTTNNGVPNARGSQLKNKRIYCSACGRRGHLVENCIQAARLLDYPVTTSRIISYTSVYPETSKSADSGININLMYDPTQPVQFRMPRNAVSFDHNANIDQEILKNDEQKKESELQNIEYTKVFSDPACDYIPLESGPIAETTKENLLRTQAKIYMNESQVTHLQSAKGSKDLEELAQAWNITTILKPTSIGYMLTLDGTATDQEMFRNDLLNNIEEHVYKYDGNKEVEVPVPKRVFLLIKDLSRYLLKLYEYLGNVHELHNEVMEFTMHPSKSSDLKTRGARRSLNMILFGQAGLENGHVYLKRLLELFKNLTAMSENQVVDKEMRKEIGEILRFIFSYQTRDNYAQLIAKYDKLPNKNIVPQIKESTNIKENGNPYGAVKRKLQPNTRDPIPNKCKKITKPSAPRSFQRYFE